MLLGRGIVFIQSFMSRSNRICSVYSAQRLEQLLHCTCYGLIVVKRDRKKSERSNPQDEREVVYYSKSRVAVFSALVITFDAIAFLTIPVYLLLWQVNRSPNQLVSRSPGVPIAILSTFTFGFALTLAILTNASRQEVLGVSAGCVLEPATRTKQQKSDLLKILCRTRRVSKQYWLMLVCLNLFW